MGEASGGYFSVFMRIPCMMIIMDIMPVITWLVVWNMNGGLEFQHEKQITIVMLIIRL